MGNLTISMAIFNSYFDITRGYLSIILDIVGYISHYISKINKQ